MASMDYAQMQFLTAAQETSYSEEILRWEERQKERVRIARELHDTLFQGFVSASLLLHRAVEETPSNSPSKNSLVRALALMQRVIEEGRVALQGLRGSAAAPNSLETALSGLREDVALDSAVEFRILVTGKPRRLDANECEQLYLIAREAVANAIRHSGAAKVEVELEYTARRVKLAIRDNGCGMNQAVVPQRGNGHWGLLGMRERAENIGGRLRIWSRPCAGTEIEVSLEKMKEWPAAVSSVA